MQLNPKSQNKKKIQPTSKANVTGRSVQTQLKPHASIMSGVGKNFWFSELSGFRNYTYGIVDLCWVLNTLVVSINCITKFILASTQLLEPK